MKVEVLFKSHRYEEFDSSTQTCPEPYRGKGLNVLTDWNLYLGSLEENGIILVQHWYDGDPAGDLGGGRGSRLRAQGRVRHAARLP